MISEINTFLFDFDGTILDSRKAIVNVFYELFQKYGDRQLTYEMVDQQFGISFRSILAGLDSHKQAEIVREYFELLPEEEERSARLFPGMKENIFYLKNEGFNVALVTNKEKILVMRSLKKFEIFDLFDVIVTLDDVEKPKPEAEPIELALRSMKAQKGKSVMIGDSVFDVEAAKNAGIMSCVIDWQNNYPPKGTLPDFLFENINDLMIKFAKYKAI